MNIPVNRTSCLISSNHALPVLTSNYSLASDVTDGISGEMKMSRKIACLEWLVVRGMLTHSFACSRHREATVVLPEHDDHEFAEMKI